RVDPAADVELRRQAQESGGEPADQIVDDPVRDGLVKRPFASVRPDVELQRLQLDALGVRNVLEVERCEVRLTRLRAQTGELWDADTDRVVAAALRIRKGLEDRRRRLWREGSRHVARCSRRG